MSASQDNADAHRPARVGGEVRSRRGPRVVGAGLVVMMMPILPYAMSFAAGAMIWTGVNLYQAMMVRGETEDAARQTATLALSLGMLVVSWSGVAMAFGAWVWFERGADLGLKYYTGFFIEKALSPVYPSSIEREGTRFRVTGAAAIKVVREEKNPDIQATALRSLTVVTSGLPGLFSTKSFAPSN